MRAARPLDMLLLLQHHGRATCRQLAETLEVSERTVLRDVEAQCLFLVVRPRVAHRLGLGAPTLTVRKKLLGSLAPGPAKKRPPS